tara:strand:- start:812 stop:1537 length:726 start_codon:yes stop_codon:yes gene_type:complete
MLIVAHRGASGTAPENTLASFKLAWQKNADAIEGDFQLTKDGVIVCIHDDNTERVGDQNLIVVESTLQELKTVDIGSYRAKEFSDERIPTLDEVIATIPNGKKILIEVKCGTEIVPILMDQLDQSKLKPDQIVIISYDADVVRSSKALAPQYQVYWLYDFDENCDIGNITATLVDIRADGLSSNNIKSKDLVDAVLELGLTYHAGWTMIDLVLVCKVIDWGASSITTNNPKRLRKMLTSSA